MNDNTSRFFTFLGLQVRLRLRRGIVSPLLMFAVVVGMTIFPDKNGFANNLGVFGSVMQLWAPMLVWIACNRAREEKLFRTIGRSNASSRAVTLGVLLGGAWLEWSVCLALLPFVVEEFGFLNGATGIAASLMLTSVILWMHIAWNSGHRVLPYGRMVLSCTALVALLWVDIERMGKGGPTGDGGVLAGACMATAVFALRRTHHVLAARPSSMFDALVVASSPVLLFAFGLWMEEPGTKATLFLLHLIAPVLGISALLWMESEREQHGGPQRAVFIGTVALAVLAELYLAGRHVPVSGFHDRPLGELLGLWVLATAKISAWYALYRRMARTSPAVSPRFWKAWIVFEVLVFLPSGPGDSLRLILSSFGFNGGLWGEYRPPEMSTVVSAIIGWFIVAGALYAAPTRRRNPSPPPLVQPTNFRLLWSSALSVRLGRQGATNWALRYLPIPLLAILLLLVFTGTMSTGDGYANLRPAQSLVALGVLFSSFSVMNREGRKTLRMLVRGVVSRRALAVYYIFGQTARAFLIFGVMGVALVALAATDGGGANAIGWQFLHASAMIVCLTMIALWHLRILDERGRSSALIFVCLALIVSVHIKAMLGVYALELGAAPSSAVMDVLSAALRARDLATMYYVTATTALDPFHQEQAELTHPVLLGGLVLLVTTASAIGLVSRRLQVLSGSPVRMNWALWLPSLVVIGSVLFGPHDSGMSLRTCIFSAWAAGVLVMLTSAEDRGRYFMPIGLGLLVILVILWPQLSGLSVPGLVLIAAGVLLRAWAWCQAKRLATQWLSPTAVIPVLLILYFIVELMLPWAGPSNDGFPYGYAMDAWDLHKNIESGTSGLASALSTCTFIDSALTWASQQSVSVLRGHWEFVSAPPAIFLAFGGTARLLARNNPRRGVSPWWLATVVGAALAASNTVLRQPPTASEIRSLLNERDSEARAESALRIHAASPELLVPRAILGSTPSGNDDAMSHLDALLRQYPGSVELLLARAELQEGLGEHLGAIRDLSAVLALHPHDRTALARRAAVLEQSGRFEECLADLDPLLLGAAPDDVLSSLQAACRR